MPPTKRPTTMETALCMICGMSACRLGVGGQATHNETPIPLQIPHLSQRKHLDLSEEHRLWFPRLSSRSARRCLTKQGPLLLQRRVTRVEHGHKTRVVVGARSGLELRRGGSDIERGTERRGRELLRCGAGGGETERGLRGDLEQVCRHVVSRSTPSSVSDSRSAMFHPSGHDIPIPAKCSPAASACPQ